MKASIRFLSAIAIAFTVVNHAGIDLSAVESGQGWMQSDRAEARPGRRSRGSFTQPSAPPRSTTSTSSWSNGSGSGRSTHTTSTWSNEHGSGHSTTTTTTSTSTWRSGSTSGRSSQTSVIQRRYSSLPATETSDDLLMRLMVLFLLLGGGIAAGLLVYLIYKQMESKQMKPSQTASPSDHSTNSQP